MSATLAAPAPSTDYTRQLMLDLHKLLNDIEPSRWKDEREAQLRQRLADIHARFDETARHYAQSADHKLQLLRERFAEMSALMALHMPSISPDEAAPAQASAVAASPSAHPNLDEVRAAWMAFRASAEPAYEALVASLKSEDVVLPSLRPTNYTRNFFHIASAMLGLLFAELLPEATSLGFLLATLIAVSVAIMGWGMELGRRMSTRINAFLMWLFSLVSHPHEAHHVNSATWYVTSLALLSLTFNPLVCGVALAILGFSDPAAAIIGKRYGKHRFDNGRSVEGTLTFVLVGTLVATATMAIFHGDVALWRALVIAFAASTAGGLTELFSTRLDDNLGIPVSAGLAAWGTWFLTGLV